MSSLALPRLPASHKELARYIADHPETPIAEILQPYREYEATLRQLYAQDPGNQALQMPDLNIMSLFATDSPGIHIRARDPAAESEQQKQHYIMALPDAQRRPGGSPAVVESLKEFQKNFNVFSESSLSEMDWTNVVAAGSSVVNCLLSVPERYNTSKRRLREFYHEKFCPASDVDLFLYGMTDEEAIEKIRQIETAVRDAILAETTTVRTKNAITICSEYPVRHVQIVLRIYKDISEILTGFDVDCSAAAYDGKQVYCSPRALESYITQINRIDLSRRSPSYESRLSKYSHRGFEVYWPNLDRSRIDPTIFERSFKRTLGLARLLVLERLPTSTARDEYLAKRRQERGRPPLERPYFRRSPGNIKLSHEDEVADWLDEDEVSNYHTFTLPYGVKYSAKKIEKLCYTRDLLLNAEWNQPKERQVYLHRHPAFFGRVDDVVNDCCGFCPQPETDEEHQIHQEESKVYVSGRISFITDDPGRQQIGSFRPLSAADWTDMAYVGNTARLCQDIVDGQLELVEHWLAQEGANPNRRDYTGRTPLHLAVMQGTPEIVKALVDRGARLVARLADGRTALHLAAERGDVEIVKILMDKSFANEAKRESKEAHQNQARSSEPDTSSSTEENADQSGDGDVDLVDDVESEDAEQRSTAAGSFVKLRGNVKESPHDSVLEEDENDPDIFDLSVVAWDTPCSALHLAVICGHEKVVQLLCQEYGADVLQPVKVLGYRHQSPTILLSLVLSANLPVPKAKSMTKTMLSLGATCAQADKNGITAFHRLVHQDASALVEVILDSDKIGVKNAINHMAFSTWSSSTRWPLKDAIENDNTRLILQLLDVGAAPHIGFELWLKAAKHSSFKSRLRASLEDNIEIFETTVEQPIIMALQCPDPIVVVELIKRGADPNTMTIDSRKVLKNKSRFDRGETVLDLVRGQKKRLRDYKPPTISPPELQYGMDEALGRIDEGTWKYATIKLAVDLAKRENQRKLECHNAGRYVDSEGGQMKQAAIDSAVKALEKIERELLAKGAKTFEELYPEYQRPESVECVRWEPPRKSLKFEAEFTIHPDNNLTEKRKAKYIELFEAAWIGDLDKIKALTLASWDPDNNEPPLQMAVKDSNSSPFSIAYFRGHHDVAKAILEIAQAQYTVEEEPSKRYYMQDDDSIESEGSGSESDIYGEIVDQITTIENVGQVSLQVKSHIKPLQMLNWELSTLGIEEGKAEEPTKSSCCLLRCAIVNNDRNGLRYYHDLVVYFAAQDEKADDSLRSAIFPQWAFQLAVERGHLDILTDMIRWTGAGLPLEDLVQKTDDEPKERIRSYQGLTVYGNKRKDWARAGRHSFSRYRPRYSETSPLWYAARAGSIEAVEWFLSDAPLRHYLEFGQSEKAKADVRWKHLSQSPGGIAQAVSRWLDAEDWLLVHDAILAPDNERADRLVKYLIRIHPASLEIKNADGKSPLALATSLGKLNLTAILIAHGANQLTKDTKGNNLLHQAVGMPTKFSSLRAFLNSLDPTLRKHLLKERSSLLTSDGCTPLHRWINTLGRHRNDTLEHNLEQLRAILEFSDGAELEALNGEGNTPLHTLIRNKEHPAIIKEVIQTNPMLLFRENAVGLTPAELAHDMFVKACVQPPQNDQFRNWPRALELVADKLIRNMSDRFPIGYRKTQSEFSLIRPIHDVVQEFVATCPVKRRLVSLSEATDVALRIGEGYQRQRYGWKGFKSRQTSPGQEHGEVGDESTG